MGKLNTQKGMTLIELLASITISMLILGIVLTLFHMVGLNLREEVKNKDRSFDSTELLLHFSRTLSSPKQILFENENQLTYQGTEGNYYRLTVNEEMIEISKCQSCGSIQEFEEETKIYEERMNGQIQFLDQDNNRLQPSENLLNQTIKIRITYPITITTPTGQEKTKHETKTWIVTPTP